MKTKFKIFLIWLIVTAIPSLVLAKNKILQGGIEHSQILEPMPQELGTGQYLQPNKLPKSSSNLIWYQIPNWLAGKWQRNYITITESSNENADPTGRKNLKQTYDYGIQVDNNLNIWDCIPLPRYRTIVDNNQGVYIQTYYTRIIESSGNLVTKEARAREIYFDVNSNQILKSLQYESITIITKIKDKKAKIESSTKFYSDRGQPYANDKRVSILHKIGAFTPKFEGPNGINYRQAFYGYLNENNLLNLLPQN